MTNMGLKNLEPKIGNAIVEAAGKKSLTASMMTTSHWWFGKRVLAPNLT